MKSRGRLLLLFVVAVLVVAVLRSLRGDRLAPATASPDPSPEAARATTDMLPPAGEVGPVQTPSLPREAVMEDAAPEQLDASVGRTTRLVVLNDADGTPIAGALVTVEHNAARTYTTCADGSCSIAFSGKTGSPHLLIEKPGFFHASGFFTRPRPRPGAGLAQ